MKNLKKYLIPAAAAVMCLSLGACGNTQGSVRPQDDLNEGLGGDGRPGGEDTITGDFSVYEGIWLGDENNQYDYLEIDRDGSWFLYFDGDVVDDGYLQYEPEWESIYAYSSQDGSASRFALEDGGELYITSFGYFSLGEDMEYIWYEDDNVYYSWNPELYQRNVSEFEGIWYYDGDLAAETYIVIDGDGNWSYYQRAAGAEPAEMDWGTFSYSTDEASIYYADSALYDGVSYRVFEHDEDMLVWGDEGVYYLME